MGGCSEHPPLPVRPVVLNKTLTHYLKLKHHVYAEVMTGESLAWWKFLLHISDILFLRPNTHCIMVSFSLSSFLLSMHLSSRQSNSSRIAEPFVDDLIIASPLHSEITCTIVGQVETEETENGNGKLKRKTEAGNGNRKAEIGKWSSTFVALIVPSAHARSNKWHRQCLSP